MSERTSMKAISARVAGLRQAMEAVMQGSTPDFAKWSGVNSFARTYCELAIHYVDLTGDRSVKIYDTSKLRNASDTVWPAQKGLFDTIYADTLMLHNLVTHVETAPAGPLYNLFVSHSYEGLAIHFK